jgi:hypothetical protein
MCNDEEPDRWRRNKVVLTQALIPGKGCVTHGLSAVTIGGNKWMNTTRFLNTFIELATIPVIDLVLVSDLAQAAAALFEGQPTVRRAAGALKTLNRLAADTGSAVVGLLSSELLADVLNDDTFKKYADVYEVTNLADGIVIKHHTASDL